MGTMRNEFKKVNIADRNAAAKKIDLEAIVHNAKTEYHNTAVHAASAEAYANRKVNEHLIEENKLLWSAVASLQEEINALKGMMMKPSHRKVTIVEETNIPQHMDNEDIALDAPYYSPTGRINWNYQKIDPTWTPIRIAYNEFDIYRREHNIYSMFGQEEVKHNWSTLYNSTPKLIAKNMTLGKLLKQYAQDRHLNY